VTADSTDAAATTPPATTDLEPAITQVTERTEPDETEAGADTDTEAGAATETESDDPEPEADAPSTEREPETLGGHVRAVIEGETGTVRLLDGEFGTLEEAPAEEAFDLLVDADPVPTVVVLDAELEQRVVDVCAQHGVQQVVTRSEGEFVKRPASVRIRTAQRLLHPTEPD
jgi:hypothetical protein